MNEWAEVSSKLLVGSCPMKPDDLKRIKHDSGATALLSLQHDDCHSYWSIDYPAMYAAGRQCGLIMQQLGYYTYAREAGEGQDDLKC